MAGRGKSTKPPHPLPAGDPWRDRILEVEWLSAYATAFRYPTDAGRLKEGPPDQQLEAHRKLTEWVALAQGELLSG